MASDTLHILHTLHSLRLLQTSSLADYVALTIIALAGATYLTRGIVWDRPDPYRYLMYERPQLKHGDGKTTSSREKETRNIAHKLADAGKKIVVFWGSQSGTAEGFAHRLARELPSRFGEEEASAMAADLSDYEPESIAQIPDSMVVIFLLSTYGEGDPSDNTWEFWDWITRDDTKGTSLSNLRYCAFGLGNSNYKHYNRVVDVVTAALDRLGAHSLMPVGKADDAEGATREDFLAWKDELFQMLTEKLGFEVQPQTGYTPALEVQEDESLQPVDLHRGEPVDIVNSNSSNRHSAAFSPVKSLTVTSIRQLFHTSDRHCLHIELDLSDHPQLTYKTGDHLAIWPGNPDSEVDRLLDVLGLTQRRQVPIHIKPRNTTTRLPIPTPTTVEAVLRYYLEICAPVSRDQVLELAQFSPTAQTKAYLLQIGQNKQAYADLLSRTHVLTLARLLQLACPGETWSALPLSYLIETLPRLQPRYYSISSSSVVSPRQSSITVLVPDAHALTSNYLLSLTQHLESKPHPHGLTYQLNGPDDALQPGNKVFAHLRRSKFKLPARSSSPLIMVAAGTGLAPFRAFLAERCRLKAIGRPVGEMLLFFGCRRPEEDYIYREELEEMQTALNGQLRVVTAFSRQAGQPRRYVQDRIVEYAADVIRLVEDEGANVYVCGRAGMAREVERVVGEMLKKVKGWSEAEVDEWIRAAKRRMKWQEDVWG